PTLPEPPARSTRIRSAGAFRARYPPPMLQKSHVFAISSKSSLTIRASEAPRNAPFRTVLHSIRRIGAPGWQLRRGDATYVSDRQCWVGRLISRRVFFIHQRAGEVAEWSKALPC